MSTSSEADDDFRRRKRHFERRSLAATQGRHLPTLTELLRDCSFMSDSIAIDAQTFAERVLPRVRRDKPEAAALVRALEQLTVDPKEAEFLDAAAAFGELIEVHGILPSPSPAVCAMRCHFYAASSGSRESAWRVAADAVSLAYDRLTPHEEALEYAQAAVGWLLYASRTLPTVIARIGHGGGWMNGRGVAAHMGERMLTRMMECRERLKKLEESSSAREDAPPSAPPMGSSFGNLLRVDMKKPEEEAPEADDSEPDDVVVFPALGNADTADGKRTAKEFEKVIGKRLPLVPVVDLVDVQRTMLAEFPYAERVLAVFMETLTARRNVAFRPTILVGTPGCGKTTFAERLLHELDVPHEIYSCGGVADTALAGTARRWSTGEPSLPVSLIRRYALASPGIILDEIEKVGTSRHNGNLLDALLGLLEPRSSQRWHDPYVETGVNLSHVIWLGTANTLDGVPSPLRDRCRIIQFPEPGPEHLEALAPRLLTKAYLDRGLDVRWATPLDGEELDALRTFWRGGSIRRLSRMVEAIMTAREQARSVH